MHTTKKGPGGRSGLMNTSAMRGNVQYLQFLLLALPGVMFLLFFNYMPMLGMIAAFKNYRFTNNFFTSLVNSKWVGFKNFTFLFKTDAFLITRNTLLYNLAFIVIGIVVAVTVAIAISELRNRKRGRVYQAILIFPYYVSWVIAGYMFYAFLSQDKGLFNHVLAAAGMDPVAWYSETKYWPFILVLCNIWKRMGYESVIYLAAIQGIPTELYEAAEVDGAGKWSQILHITLPSLKTIMITMTMMAMGKMFYSDFGLFYQLPRQSGQLFPVTSVIDTYVYTSLRNSLNIGMASAAGVYQSIVGFVLVLLANTVVKKIEKDSALF